MRNIRFLYLIVFETLIFQVRSNVIIENTTVSSDLIQNLFFKEIRSNSKLFDIDVAEILEGQKCIQELTELAKLLPSYQALRFVDSWGRIPSGILSGHTLDIGNYDQCVETAVKLIPSHGITNGQYCFASFPNLLSYDMISRNDKLTLKEDLEIAGKAFDMSINLRIGVCIPHTCRPELVNKILRKALDKVLFGRLAGSNISNCSVAKKEAFRTIDIFAIVFFSFIGLLMLLSTFYDCWTIYFEKKPVPLLLAFSVKSNGSKLFMISTEKSSNSITCLTGIRVFSIIWVIYCHNYAFYSSLNIVNVAYSLTWAKNLWSMTVLMGTVSVDSFFLLSGLLVAWIGLKELDKTRGKLNIPLMYLHRYIRLTPALAAVILFYITINKYIGSGPFRVEYKGCDKTWWLTLLYIQNYAHGFEKCVDQSWYLACDTQLYVLSPLVLIPLWRWGKRFIPAIVTLAFLSIGCCIATYFSRGYTNILGLGNPLLTMPNTYWTTHTRYYVWLVGIVVGYVMHKNRNNKVRIPVIVQLTGWILSLGIMIAIIFAPHFMAEFPYDSTVTVAALYEPLKRLFWAIALAWIVFACHFGYGGLINSILSHPVLQPLGRLTYCMYLVHLAVQNINYGITRTDVYFSDYTMILLLWNNFGITLLSAVVLSLSFEAPILVIEKAIFGTTRRKSTTISCDNLMVAPSSQGKEF